MAEGKPEAKDVEANPPEPLNSKTWVLRVSIHCEGCKKKVKKILHKIEGVERTEIDLKQQRVTVTGNVEAETLMGRLEKKTGKRPLLLLPLPDKATTKAAAAPKEKKQSKPVMPPKERDNPPNNISNDSSLQEGEAPEGNSKAAKKKNKKKKAESPEPEPADGDRGADNGKTADAGEEAKEEKRPEEAKEKATAPAGGDQSPVPEENQKPAAESEKSGGGSGGKKKKPRGQNGDIETSKEGRMGKVVPGGDEPDRVDRSPGSGPSRDQGQGLGMGPMNDTPPLHRRFEAYPYPNPYAPPHYYQGPPAYAVSYNTAYPSSSQGAAYYAPRPPPNSYAYVHPGQESQRMPPYSDPYSLQPSDSFELFSDENPNACSIM